MLHQQYAPPPVRSLLNHLDAALAACDPCVRRRRRRRSPICSLELTRLPMVRRVRQERVRLADGAIRSQITLFLTVTGCLEETTLSGAAAIGLEPAATRLIGGRIEVATLMALTAAMRDVVELCFVALNDEADAQHQLPPVITEALVWATSPDCT